MEENPHDAPQEPAEPGARRKTFLAIAAPLVLPSAAVALCTTCIMNGAVQSTPMWSFEWLVSVSILAIAAISLVFSLVYLAVAAIRDLWHT